MCQPAGGEGSVLLHFEEMLPSKDHQFSIEADKPYVKVSWQITGIRHDAFARTHPLLVEEPKPTMLRSYYIHPELYGQSQEKQIEWARHPAMMKRMRAIREAQVKNLVQSKR